MLKLRKFEESDIETLINWVEDEEFLMTWAGPSYKYPLTKNQILDEMDYGKKEKNILYFSAIDDKSKQIIGHIQLLRIDMKNKKAVVGRVLIGDKKLRKKGYGFEMLNELFNIAFNNLGLEELELYVFSYNKSAIECYKRAGFKEKEIIKGAREFKGEKIDLVHMNIVNVV